MDQCQHLSAEGYVQMPGVQTDLPESEIKVAKVAVWLCCRLRDIAITGTLAAAQLVLSGSGLWKHLFLSIFTL